VLATEIEEMSNLLKIKLPKSSMKLKVMIDEQKTTFESTMPVPSARGRIISSPTTAQV